MLNKTDLLFFYSEQIKDLENKLKEQEQESQSHSLILQNKVAKIYCSMLIFNLFMSKWEVGETIFIYTFCLLLLQIKELETKLRVQEEQSTESLVLRQKVKPFIQSDIGDSCLLV